jgi:hypothetical protein
MYTERGDRKRAQDRFLWLKTSPRVINLTSMESFFVPYTGKKPAAVSINGHRLVILTHEKDTLEEDLDLLGADRVKSVKVGNADTDQEEFLGKIAKQVDGGVVIAPSGIGLRDVIKNLETELPWLQ